MNKSHPMRCVVAFVEESHSDHDLRRRAGYHLARHFRKFTGVTPAEYRWSQR